MANKEEKIYSLDLLKKQDEKIEHWIFGRLEWDVTYMNRTSIDKDIRCGLWYDIEYPKQILYEDADDTAKVEV